MFNIPNTRNYSIRSYPINRYKNCYFLLFEMLQQASTCLKPTKETTRLLYNDDAFEQISHIALLFSLLTLNK